MIRLMNANLLPTCWHFRPFYTASIFMAKPERSLKDFRIRTDYKWREKLGLPAYGNKWGPLTDLPDWSYADGRPAPTRGGQAERIRKNAELAKRAIELLDEVDHCVEQDRILKEEEQNRRRNIIKRKLSPKGNLMMRPRKPLML